MRGRLVVMGSGEIAPGLVATHRAGIEAAEADSVTLLDTPFGFQENASQLTARLADFFATSLGVEVEVATLRRPEEPAAARERFVAAIARGRYVFAGPGSPSYALRVWRDIGVAEALAGVVASGGTVTFASAAALTLGVKTIPVYEIYKVGADPFLLDGLGVTARLGLPVTVIPHWNNREGGNHDTSRCYIGERRLQMLEPQLAGGILGVDEHTAVTVDFAEETLTVTGRGGATLRGATSYHHGSGARIPLDEVRARLGGGPESVAAPAPPPAASPSFAAALEAGDADAALAALLDAEAAAATDPARRRPLRTMLVELAAAAQRGLTDPREVKGPLVEMLLGMRDEARRSRRYEEADRIRHGLGALGIEVRDTPEGSVWELEE